MEKVAYTEYREVLKPEDEEITVIVQVPEDDSYPVHVIQQAGRKMLRYSLHEFEAVSEVVYRALKEAGWTEASSPASKDYGYKEEEVPGSSPA